jgi:hypothetical protein
MPTTTECALALLLFFVASGKLAEASLFVQATSWRMSGEVYGWLIVKGVHFATLATRWQVAFDMARNATQSLRDVRT